MFEKRPIDKLTIKGFKSLQDVELELGKLNVLIGPNGAGKSNLVSFLEMLGYLVEEQLQYWVGKRGGASILLTFGRKHSAELSAHLAFGDNAYRFTLEPTDLDRFIFTGERLYFADKYPHGIQISWSGNTESRLKSEIHPVDWRMADYCYASISNWKGFHFHDTSDSAPVKSLGNVIDHDYLRSDASNLAAYLLNLKLRHYDTYDQIRKIVRLALPFFNDFVLRPDEIRLLWLQKNSDEPFFPSQLSDGSLRFICLVTALLQPDAPSTIIIDEPEIGLHPYAITLLGSLIHSASERMKIIVATQSVSMVNQFAVEDLIVVEREDDLSVFKRLNESEFDLWLEDYSVGELWEKNVLGGRLS